MVKGVVTTAAKGREVKSWTQPILTQNMEVCWLLSHEKQKNMVFNF